MKRWYVMTNPCDKTNFGNLNGYLLAMSEVADREDVEAGGRRRMSDHDMPHEHL
jgi:hypothetical protein